VAPPYQIGAALLTMLPLLANSTDPAAARDIAWRRALDTVLKDPHLRHETKEAILKFDAPDEVDSHKTRWWSLGQKR
jgi:hypothetical protein